MRLLPVMTIAVALAACEVVPGTAAPEEPPRVAVEGTVIAEGDDVRVCYRLVTVDPPKCGGQLEVVDLDAGDLPGAETSDRVTTGDARLVGELSDGSLRVTEGPGRPRGDPAAAEEEDPPRRPLAEPERSRLLALHHHEVQPMLEDAGGDAWLEAGVDEIRGHVRVTVVDGHGELAERLREEFGDDVVVQSWVTHLD